MKPPSREEPPCDDPRSLPENCASPPAGPTIVLAFRRSRPCSPLGGHSSVTVFRRSRRARLLGACARVRLSTLALASTLGSRRRPFLRTSLGALLTCPQPFAPCGAPSRVHLLVFVSAFVFRRSRPFPLRRLTVHGLASSCHVSTAFTAILFREPPLHTAPVNRACAHLATITFTLPYHRAFALVSTTWVEMSAIPRPKLAPLPRHPDRPASLDAHDPKALPCSRSRNVFTCFALGFRLELTHVHARVHFTSCDVIEHTHCARSYSAFCHRESLALSSPNSPPRSSF